MDFTAILTFITGKLLPFIFVLGILVFIHELGHFLAAKWAGIRVERFSLGFPPRMFGKQIGDTDYCISWIPLGGYVKMAGMIDESFDEQIEGRDDEFASKPIWKRAIVIGAGPAMNIMLAVMLFTGLLFFYGIATRLPIVKSVAENSPAARINLKPGDRIVRINAQEVATEQEMTSIIQANANKPLSIYWEREGQRLRAEVMPRLENGRGIIGIEIDANAISRKSVSLREAFNLGLGETWRALAKMGGLLSRYIRGETFPEGEFVGPIGIAKIIGAAAQNGLDRILVIMALLSLNLAVFNLLPFPVLDGGHLLFLGFEAIMRRPVSARVRVVLHQIAMLLLLVAMVLTTINDLRG